MNVKRKEHAESLEKRKFEFPKTIDILPLYKYNLLDDLVQDFWDGLIKSSLLLPMKLEPRL